MHRIKRVITATAVTAIMAGCAPAIAAAQTNTGSGSGGSGKQQVCNSLLPAAINTMAIISSAMDAGSAAFTVVHGAQEALYNFAEANCRA
jgi:hypothetical protein